MPTSATVVSAGILASLGALGFFWAFWKIDPYGDLGSTNWNAIIFTIYSLIDSTGEKLTELENILRTAKPGSLEWINARSAIISIMRLLERELISGGRSWEHFAAIGAHVEGEDYASQRAYTLRGNLYLALLQLLGVYRRACSIVGTEGMSDSMLGYEL